jgi:WD40 repeat protein
MTAKTEPHSPHFEAERDMRIAYADAPGADARVIHAGAYLEVHPTVSGVAATRLPSAYLSPPNLPRHFQPRETYLAPLREKLTTMAKITGITAQANGLHGMGGIGKTVTAIAAAHDNAIKAKFPDGIRWLSFGREASPLELATGLIQDLDASAARPETVEQARAALAKLSASRRLMVILDDVWTPEATRPFSALGEACRLLITTRNRPVLEAVQADDVRLGLMDDMEALSLLAGAAGLPSSDALPSDAYRIIEECGHLPLAIAAAGAMVHKDAFTWAQVLAALAKRRADLLGAGSAEPSVEAVLRLSLDALSPPARSCFSACSAFREATEIPEAALLRLWSDVYPDELDAVAQANELVERSLWQRIKESESRAYVIHDLYLDILRKDAAPLANRHAHLLERYRASCPAGWHTAKHDGYILTNLAWNMRGAGHVEELRGLLFDFRWLRHKLLQTDLNALIADFDHLQNDREARTLARTLSVSAHSIGPDPEQLAIQLHARLVAAHGPTIARLVAELDALLPIAPLRGPYFPPPGPEIRRFEGHTEAVQDVASLPNGKHCLSAANDKTIRLWNIETGSEVRRFEGHASWVLAVSPLADGKRFLSCSLDKTVRLWDIESGNEIRSFEERSGSLSAVAPLPDGRYFLAAGYKSIGLWEVETGAEVRRFTGHTAAVTGIALTPDGKRFISGGDDKTLRVWDIESGTEIGRLRGRAQVGTAALAALPDGRCIAARARSVHVFNLGTGDELSVLRAHEKSVNAVAAMADNKRILSGAWDYTVRLWDIKAGAEVGCYEGHTQVVNAIAPLPDGKRFLSASDDGTVRLRDIDVGVEIRRIEGRSDSVIVHPPLTGEGSYLTVGQDGMVRLWDIKTGAEISIDSRRCLSLLRKARLNSVVILSDRKLYLTCEHLWPGHRHDPMSKPRSVLRLLNMETGAEIRRFNSRDTMIDCIALLQDDKHFLSGNRDGTSWLWNIDSSTQIRTFEGHHGGVLAIVLLPGDRRYLSASWDKSIRLWDIETSAIIRVFEGHTGPVSDIGVLPDGKQFISVGWDGTMRLWDIKTGAQLRWVRAGWTAIWSVTILPDGQRCLISVADHSLQLWDVGLEAEIARYTGDVSIFSVTPIPGTNTILTGNQIGQVVAFRLPT